MKLRLCLPILFACAVVPIRAETPTNSASLASAPTAQAVADSAAGLKRATDALKLRADMAASVAQGDEKAADAVARLKNAFSPLGVSTDSDGDFGLAAIDLGSRLVAAHKPAEAEMFFREAEQALVRFIKKTPDRDAARKAQCLANLAIVRARYLNKLDLARRDLGAALKLQPDDPYLGSLLNMVGSVPAPTTRSNH